MKMKRTILPLGALALFGVSAGLMVRTVINPNNIKEVKATADLGISTISTDGEFADFITAVNHGTRYDNQLVQLNASVSYEITVIPTDADPFSIFDGEFDGCNHTITIKVNFTGSTPSLFGNLGNSEFKKAVFKNTNLNYSVTSGMTSGNVYVAPIATYNYGLIQNVHSTINYDEPDVNYVGGLVEKNQSTGIIEDCSVAGSISAKGYVAGIACENLGTIRNCKNNCAITSGIGAYAGGIVAINGSSSFDKAQITNCVNNASITSTGKDLGGIVGFMYSNSEMSYCDNYGSITSTSTASGWGYGGLIGRMNGKDTDTEHETKVENCYNAGNLKAVRNAGGLIGLVNSEAKPAIQVTGCLTTGDVNAITANGGTLIGWANSDTLSLDDTYAAGAKVGAAKLGVGAGTAASTATSVAKGVSDEFKQVIQYIREYNCEEEISGFEDLYNGLISKENKLLDQLNYYDNLNTYAMKTYKQAAQYIIGGDQAQIAMFSLLNMNGLDNNGTVIVIIISTIGLSSILLFLAVRGKRNAANE